MPASWRAAQLVELDGHRRIEVAEVALDALVAEEMVRAVAATREQLGRELEPDQPVGGEPEARLVLGYLVQAPHASGREHAEHSEPERVHDERVAVATACALEERRGITEQRDAGIDPAKRTPTRDGIGSTTESRVRRTPGS
jgi:hypothetical protein